MVALKGTAELTNPKVVRGSMGALFRLPAVSSDAGRVSSPGPAERGVEIWVAAADGEPIEPGARGGQRSRSALVRGQRGRRA